MRCTRAAFLQPADVRTIPTMAAERVFPASFDLVVWLVVPAADFKEMEEVSCVPRNLQGHQWIALCESVHDAIYRASWNERTSGDTVILMFTISPKGVGHFLLHGVLERAPVWGSWRWHGELPMRARDTAGDMLVQLGQVLSPAAARL